MIHVDWLREAYNFTEIFPEWLHMHKQLIPGRFFSSMQPGSKAREVAALVIRRNIGSGAGRYLHIWSTAPSALWDWLHEGSFERHNTYSTMQSSLLYQGCIYLKTSLPSACSTHDMQYIIWSTISSAVFLGEGGGGPVCFIVYVFYSLPYFYRCFFPHHPLILFPKS